MRYLPLLLLLALLSAPTMRPADAQPIPTTRYVAANGNDAWSGELPQANAAKTDGPFATLGHALAEARRARQIAPGELAVRLILRGGTYYLDQPIVLGPLDSGLVIEAFRGEEAIISGGRRVTGWQPWKGKVMQADLASVALPDLGFRELYYGAKMQPWARVPNLDPKHPRTGGFLQNAGVAEADTKTKFVYHPGDLHPEKWAHPERAWMMFHDSLSYETQYCPVKTIDPGKKTVEVAQGVYTLGKGNPFFVCGVLEELDAPGEWCVDPDAKKLYFWPPSGDPNKNAVVVPALDSVFRLEGDANANRFVQNVRLAGLAIRDCRGNAVSLTGARDCTVAACDLRNVGAGVYLTDDTHDCKVVGCDITATQGDGVTITGTTTDHERVTGHVIDNNYIWDIGWGRIHNRCGGVYMHRMMRCKVTHNLIHDTPRYAIGMDVGGDCEIAYNDCHHSNLVTMDTSVIEAATALDWGMPMGEQVERNPKCNWGNSIHHNIMHDSGGWGSDAAGELSAPRFSWGVYLDTYSSGWHVHDNFIYNTVLGAFMVNGGVGNVFENNICLNGKESQCFLETWPKYAMSGNVVQHNVFAYQGKTANLYQNNSFTKENGVYRQNLIWPADEKVGVAGTGASRKDSWAAWLKLGQDEGSAIADPQFVDASKPDWRLKATSPAFKLGFKPIDLSTVGCYASPDRRTWPRPEVRVVRDVLDYTPPESLVKPQALLRDYEDYAVGESERNANIGNEGAGTAQVTDETAAPGPDGKPSKHSLKFTDVAGLPHSFVPYVTYPLVQETGTLRMAFDLRWEKGALMALDWRDDPYKYNMGPNLTTNADGWLSANGKQMLQLPEGKWVHVEVVCGLGSKATGKYDLTIRLPDEGAKVYKDVACSPKFEALNCVVFMAVGDAPAVFYVDNLEFRPGT